MALSLVAKSIGKFLDLHDGNLALTIIALYFVLSCLGKIIIL